MALFIYLALATRRDPEKRGLFFVFSLVALWLAAVFLYLLVSAILDFN